MVIAVSFRFVGRGLAERVRAAYDSGTNRRCRRIFSDVKGGRVRARSGLLIVTALLMPALAVATVGTWGLTVWIYQAIIGPPGPPSK